MKKYKTIGNKNEIYILLIYFLIACAILANFSQLIPLKYKFGNFHFGEMLLIMFNDSYTGYFTFPFLLGFVLMIQSPTEQNIYFTLTRYSSRGSFYRKKHNDILKSFMKYFGSICIFSIIVGMFSSDFGTNISLATTNFSKMYLFGNFESSNLILEIVKILILQALLLYFFTAIYMFLIQFKISQSIVFIIYTGILILMAGTTLGFLGEIMKPYSLFSLASSVYGYGLNFTVRMAILFLIDAILIFLNFKIFENKDIVLPKGSKQYQNE